MANPTTNYGWPMPTATDLVTDLPADFAAFGQPVDTSLKALNPETTLGDIAYRSATANTNTRLGIGSTGNVLTVSGGVPVWAAPAGGGKLLQVVQGSSTTGTSSNSATYVDTTLSASITPSVNTSKVLVVVSQSANVFRSGSAASGNIKLLRGATDIWVPADRNFSYSITGSTLLDISGMVTMVYLDSPATTSATTYKTQMNYTTSGGSMTVQNSSSLSTITLFEIGA
jgi:hypothetical protein